MKTAIVTGGARGIGRQIALTLADAGMNIVINYNRSDAAALEVKALCEAKGVGAHVVRCDVSLAEDVKHLVKETIDTFGAVDVLVNNLAFGSQEGVYVQALVILSLALFAFLAALSGGIAYYFSFREAAFQKSDADAEAPFVAAADEALRIGPPPSRSSYLDIQAILAAAARTGAEAVHPGYGFFSENADFARAIPERGGKLISPPRAATEALGDTVSARTSARSVMTSIAGLSRVTWSGRFWRGR